MLVMPTLEQAAGRGLSKFRNLNAGEIDITYEYQGQKQRQRSDGFGGRNRRGGGVAFGGGSLRRPVDFGGGVPAAWIPSRRWDNLPEECS